jgi:hypothetical protein
VKERKNESTKEIMNEWIKKRTVGRKTEVERSYNEKLRHTVQE